MTRLLLNAALLALIANPTGSHADDAQRQAGAAKLTGLARLATAKPGQVAIDFKEVDAGAELTHRTTDPELVEAVHEWFDAQLSDHGADAMAGHLHHHEVELPEQLGWAPG